MMIARHIIFFSLFSGSGATGLPSLKGIAAVDRRGMAFEIGR